MEGSPTKTPRRRNCVRAVSKRTRNKRAVVKPFLQCDESEGAYQGADAATTWARSLYLYALPAPPEQSGTVDGQPVSNLDFYSKTPGQGRSDHRDQVQDSMPDARSQGNGSRADAARFSACLKDEDGVDWDDLVSRLDLSFLDD